MRTALAPPGRGRAWHGDVAVRRHIAALAALRDLDIQARRAGRAGPAIATVEPDRIITVDVVAVSATDALGTWQGLNDHVAALDAGCNVVETADRDGIVLGAPLSLASRVERVDMPAVARGAIRGRFADSAAMPMVDLGSGRAIAGARRYGVPKPFAIALAPPAA